MHTKSNYPSLLLAGLLALLAAAAAACGSANQAAGLEITDVWARAAPAAGGNSAVYMQIRNTSRQADALLAAQTTASQVVELHETRMEEDVMRMRPVEGQRIIVPASGQVSLQPGGLHVMLLNLQQPLQPGDRFDLILQFEQAGERTVSVEVRRMDGSMEPEHDGH